MSATDVVSHVPASLAAAAGLGPADAIALAVKALEGCAAIVPSSGKDDDTSDSEDEGQTSAPLFVKKLKALVDDPAVDSAVWSADGTSFVIHEPKRLSEQLVKYFKSSKLKSFVRQLHFYGFKKIGGSRFEDWIYSHKFFQQHGRLVHKLRRKTCGPDQQIKNLQNKVETLQDSLVNTQQKLGDMAVALVALLRHHNATGGGCAGGGCDAPPTDASASASTSALALQQQHVKHERNHHMPPQYHAAAQQQQQQRSTTHPIKRTRISTSQEQLQQQRLPMPLAFRDVLGGGGGGADVPPSTYAFTPASPASFTPNPMDLFDLAQDGYDLYEEYEDMDHVTASLSTVGMTA